MKLYKIGEIITKNERVTLKVRGPLDFKVLERKRGYAVSLNGYEQSFNYDNRGQLYAHIIKYVTSNYKLLIQKNHFLGIWLHNGMVYLDVTIIVNNKVNALLRASLEKQQAIYDFNACKSLYLKEYDYLINSVILFEKVSNIRDYNLIDLKYFRGYVERLNKCNACVICGRCGDIPISVYYSYNTIIFIVIDDKLYFNRLLYSTTTSHHIHKFIKVYSLKYLEWYQLKSSEWYSLIKQLDLFSQYVSSSDYYDNGLNWLIDIKEITK